MAPVMVPAPVLFLRDRFGGDFEEDEETVDVGTASVRVVYNDPEAVALTLVNTGSDNIYVAPSNLVSATFGVVLLPGGSVSVTVRDDATLPTREWWALGASAGQTLHYIRLRRYATVAQVGVQGGG